MGWVQSIWGLFLLISMNFWWLQRGFRWIGLIWDIGGWISYWSNDFGKNFTEKLKGRPNFFSHLFSPSILSCSQLFPLVCYYFLLPNRTFFTHSLSLSPIFFCSISPSPLSRSSTGFHYSLFLYFVCIGVPFEKYKWNLYVHIAVWVCVNYESIHVIMWGVVNLCIWSLYVSCEYYVVNRKIEKAPSLFY